MQRPKWLWAFPSIFLLVWLWAAWQPLDTFGWFLENLLIFLCIPVLIWMDRRHPFSTLSLALLTAFLSLHVVGSHWTYSEVPGPWNQAGNSLIDRFFSMGPGDGRNYYDRLIHFGYGLLLGPVTAEFLIAWGYAKKVSTAWVLTVTGVLATSAIYEIIEMFAAVIVDPAAADAFLGQQGDQFDAMKDMALAWIGTLLAGAIAWVVLRIARRGGPWAAQATPTQD